MIVLLNGPFGVGKTTAANLLVERLPDAMLCDPEEVGLMLFRVLSPVHEVSDFQDYDLWPKMTVEMARMLREEYGRDLIVPMTLWRRDRLQQMSDGLRDVDPDFRIFNLTASREILRRRIFSRPNEEGDHGWSLAHVERGMATMDDAEFGEKVETEGRMPGEVVEDLLGRLAISHPKTASP